MIDRIATQGDAAPSAEQSARCLFERWQPVFDVQHTDSFAMNTFASFAQNAGQCRVEAPSVEDIEAIIARTNNSAAGPDGVPYAAFRSVKDLAASVLHCAVEAALRGDDLPADMAQSLMMFIPKDDSENITRAPDAVRPLSLSNSDAKLFAAVINVPLAAIAQLHVAPQQSGFVRGRSMSSNIARIEAAGLAASLTSSADSAAMIFFDFAAAFPSLAHSFIFFILKCMNIDSRLIGVLQRLYDGCISQICIGGARFMNVKICSGIKQGCL